MKLTNAVATLYAQGAMHKQLWARSTDPATSDHHLAAGDGIAKGLIESPSADLADLDLKLAELQEWIAEDITEIAAALLSSIIRDVRALRQRSPEGVKAAKAASLPPKPLLV